MTTVCFHKTTALIGWLMFGLLTNKYVAFKLSTQQGCRAIKQSMVSVYPRDTPTKAFQATFIVLSLGSFISRKYYVNATTPLNTKQFEQLL